MDELAHEPSSVEAVADVREPESTAAESGPVSAPRSGSRAAPARTSIRRAILQAKLTVGASDDPYEREADAVADRVVRSLGSGATAVIERPADTAVQRVQRMDASVAQFEPLPVSPIGRQIRRMTVQRVATIGAAGGDLDIDTERRVQRAKGGGHAMPASTRGPMERAFGTDFGHIRMHTGSGATDLNDRIQAKAFTTGNDIFFRDGMPDTTTRDGQHLLAHELTHTVQQGGVQRKATIMRKWWKFGRGKKPMEISGPTDTTMLSDTGGGHQDARAQAEARYGALQPIQPVAEPEAAWSGQAGQQDTPGVEVAKPAAAVTTAGVTGTSALVAAGQLGAGASAGGAGTAAGNVAAGGGVGGGTLGLLTMGDAALGLANANAMHNEAQAYDDDAMAKQARGKAKDQSAALLMGGAATAKGVATTVDVFQSGAAAVAEGAAPAAAGVAAGAAGIVGGSAMVLQGAWRGGKAVMKLCRLTWGRGQHMYSDEGARWKRVIVAAEQFKAGINALKIAAGALGIAAGALFIVGSPVGWAIGIAAAVGAGAFAIGKIVGKVRNAWDKSRAAKLEGAQLDIGDPEDATMNRGGEQVAVREGMADLGYDMSTVRVAGPHNERDHGEGMTPTGPSNATASDDDQAARDAVIAEADRLAVEASQNAAVAAELRHALSQGDKDLVFTSLESAAENEEFDLASALLDPEDARLHDSFMLLSAINIDPDQALASSGQTLIEKKLSKAEAM